MRWQPRPPPVGIGVADGLCEARSPDGARGAVLEEASRKRVHLGYSRRPESTFREAATRPAIGESSGRSDSLFDSAAGGFFREASARIQWLARELAWPAVELPPDEAAIRKDGYLLCPWSCLLTACYFSRLRRAFCKAEPVRTIQTMDTEPQEDVPKEFYDLVDRFIGLANELSAEYSVPQISAVLLYAAARYNTHCMVEADPDILENREEAVDYFTEQYRSMLEENVDKIT